MLNDVKVIICGKEYKMKTAESPNYVLSLARSLESKINNLIDAGAGISPYSAAIMVSLGVLDDLNKSIEYSDNVKNKSKEYVDEAGKSKIDLEAALKEIEVLKSKIVQLENIVKLRELSNSIND